MASIPRRASDRKPATRRASLRNQRHDGRSHLVFGWIFALLAMHHVSVLAETGGSQRDFYALALLQTGRLHLERGELNEGKTFLARAVEVDSGLDTTSTRIRLRSGPGLLSRRGGGRDLPRPARPTSR